MRKSEQQPTAEPIKKMQFSYSRVQTFLQCQYQYKLRYIDKIKTLRDIVPEEANNALIIGKALHTGIETTALNAINEYLEPYYIINDNHITEGIKLINMISKAKQAIPNGGSYEVMINTDEFKGFIDLLRLTKRENGYDVYDIYDFKYSNHQQAYLESSQLHLYKYFYEKQFYSRKIEHLYYVFIPKISIREKETEETYTFRKRLKSLIKESEITIKEVQYDENKVLKFLEHCNQIRTATEYLKNESHLCEYCNYKEFCKSGATFMLLPENKRRNAKTTEHKRIWIYGKPLSGKTYLSNQFPDPLMLNTDGNIDNTDAPYITIKDIVTTEGRITKRKFAWEVFKETIEELEKKQNTFKTIIVDLLEDTQEQCRLYMYNKLGIDHETDLKYGRGWDQVKFEFLTTLKRLMMLDYEYIVLLSHENNTATLTNDSGESVNLIQPNIKNPDKIAGMCNMIVRLIKDNDNRKLQINFKKNEFGGGRMKTNSLTFIDPTFLEIEKLYTAEQEENNKKTNEKRGN